MKSVKTGSAEIADSELGKYRDLFENSWDVIFMADSKGIITYVSPSSKRVFGFTPKDMIGNHFARFISSKDLPMAMSNFQEAFRNNTPDALSLHVKAKGGSDKIIELTASNIIENGKFAGVHGIIRDVTERVRSEEELERSIRFSDMLIDTANAIIVCLDLEGNITRFNHAAELMTGYSRREVKGKNWFRFFVPRKRFPKVWDVFSKLPKGKLIKNFENPIITKSGKERIIFWQNSTLRENRKIVGSLSFGTDITEAKKNQEALNNANKFNSDIIENAPFGVFTVNDKGFVDYVNPAMIMISGANKEQFLGLEIMKVPAYVKLGLSEKISNCFKGKSFFMERVEYVSHFGKKRTVRNFTGIPMRINSKAITGVMIFVEEITNYVMIEENLRDSESRYKLVIDRTGQLIYDYDVASGKIQWMGAIKQVSGYEPDEFSKVGIKGWAMRIHPEDRVKALNLLEKSRNACESYHAEYRLMRKDKRYRYVEDNGIFIPDRLGNAARMVGAIKDITDRMVAFDEINKRTHELERFNKLAVGRELRMIELKKQIGALQKGAYLKNGLQNTGQKESKPIQKDAVPKEE